VSLIQSPDIGRKLQQNLRLTELPDQVLASETVAVIVVEDLSDPLLGTALGCMGSVRRAAVAAENSIVVLTRVGSPATYSLKVTKVFISSPNAQIVTLAVPTVGVTGLTLSGSTSFRDFNTPGRPSSSLGSDTTAAVPAHRNLFQGRLTADTPLILKVDLELGTIGQGDDLTGLMVIAETQQTDLIAGFEWTEAPPLG